MDSWTDHGRLTYTRMVQTDEHRHNSINPVTANMASHAHRLFPIFHNIISPDNNDWSQVAPDSCTINLSQGIICWVNISLWFWWQNLTQLWLPIIDLDSD